MLSHDEKHITKKQDKKLNLIKFNKSLIFINVTPLINY